MLIGPFMLYLLGSTPFGHVCEPHGSNFTFVGAATTTSTAPFLRQLGEFATLVSAIASIQWQPISAASVVQIVTMDNGPTNFVEIGRFSATDVSSDRWVFPVAESIDITANLRNQLNVNTQKNIGYRMASDGVSHVILYGLWVTLVYDVPVASGSPNIQHIADIIASLAASAPGAIAVPTEAALSPGMITWELETTVACGAVGNNTLLSEAALAVTRQCDVQTGAAVVRPGVEQPAMWFRYNTRCYNTNALTV